MKVIKRYKVLKLIEQKIDDDTFIKLEVPTEGSWYSRSSLGEYDTEEEAIEKAYKFSEWGSYAIIPVISFDNY